MRVRISVALSGAAQRQAGPQRGGVDIHPPLLDLEGADAARAQCLAERLHVVRQHLAHPERRHERARDGGIAGEVGDAGGEHAGIQRAGDLADQAGADDGAIRFVDVRAQLPGLGIRRVRRAPSARRRRRPRTTSAARRMPGRARAPNHSAELDDRTVDAHPLRLGVVRAARERSKPGPELDAERPARREAEGPVERRRVVLAARQPRRLGVPGRAARGVEPHARPTPSGRRPRRAACRTSAARPERREVVGRHRRGDLVGVDGQHVEAQRRRGRGRRRRCRSRGRRPARPPRPGTGGRAAPRPAAGWPARARPREQHPAGEVAELRHGLRAQPRLADTAETSSGECPAARSRDDLAGDVRRRRRPRSSSRSPSGGQQRGEFGHLHPPSLRALRHRRSPACWHSRCMSASTCLDWR